MTIFFRAAALDHVGRQCPRAAAEANKRHLAVEFLPDQADRIGDIAQARLRVGYAEPVDFRRAAQRALELRSFALGEVKPETHRVRNGQNIGEQDCGVERESPERLQRHLAGQFGILAQVEKRAGLLASRAIFGQITPGLAHDPNRRGVGGLAQQRPDQTIVLQLRISHQTSSA